MSLFLPICYYSRIRFCRCDLLNVSGLERKTYAIGIIYLFFFSDPSYTCLSKGFLTNFFFFDQPVIKASNERRTWCHTGIIHMKSRSEDARRAQSRPFLLYRSSKKKKTLDVQLKLTKEARKGKFRKKV